MQSSSSSVDETRLHLAVPEGKRKVTGDHLHGLARDRKETWMPTLTALVLTVKRSLLKLGRGLSPTAKSTPSNAPKRLQLCSLDRRIQSPPHRKVPINLKLRAREDWYDEDIIEDYEDDGDSDTRTGETRYPNCGYVIPLNVDPEESAKQPRSGPRL